MVSYFDSDEFDPNPVLVDLATELVEARGERVSDLAVAVALHEFRHGDGVAE